MLWKINSLVVEGGCIETQSENEANKNQNLCYFDHNGVG